MGRPYTLEASLSAQEVIGYFNTAPRQFLIYNGILPIFSAFFFLWFLGMLHSMLWHIEGDEIRLSSAALAGGVMYITLAWAAVAVEILYPATLARFENFQQDVQLVFLSQALSAWLYHFAWIGMSVLISATSVVALRTGVIPRWLTFSSFVVALVALLYFLIPLGALLGWLWVVAISVLMVAGLVDPSGLVRRRLAGSA